MLTNIIISLVLLFPITVWTRPGDGNSTKKVLFVTNSERGQANINLATTHALLADYHTSVDVHIASFPAIADAVSRVSDLAIKSIVNSDQDAERPPSQAQGITFHALPGPSYEEVLLGEITIGEARHAPGLSGIKALIDLLKSCVLPWKGPEYVQHYHNVRKIITELDPALVVVDPLFSPAVDAVRSLNRSHAILSPNSLKDTFAAQQPMGRALWHYPAFSSAYPYPVPLHLIPANIYISLRTLGSLVFSSRLRALDTYIKTKGLPPRSDIFNVYQEDVPWLSASSPQIEYPFTLPENVITCGPIFMALDSVEDGDPDLYAWLERGPTVLIVLGSHTVYDNSMAIGMARAIRMVLDRSEDDSVQVLWKLRLLQDEQEKTQGGDILSEEISALLSTGRVRIESWLSADPASLLETGHIICYVNHGGANSFGEAIGTGVPQVILAMWADTHDFAVRAEWLGVGVWGNRQVAPLWTAEEVGHSVLRVISADEGPVYREKAKALALPSIERPGSAIAASAIVRLLADQERIHTDESHSDRVSTEHNEL